MKKYTSRVAPGAKERVTLPTATERQSSVKPEDEAKFSAGDGGLRVRLGTSRLVESYQALPPLEESYTLQEMTQIANDEHALSVAGEMSIQRQVSR